MKTKLHATLNDLKEKTRMKVVALLNQHLADTADLYLQSKQAHWNVKGPNFIALHELFDELGEDLEDYTDDIAERAVELGGIARGTVRVAAKQSRLAEYPLEINAGRDHVEALATGLAALAKSVRAAINEASELGDLDTADLFTEISRGLDKWLWKLEAHLQADR